VVKVGGVKREFDTEITEQTPDQVIAWRSTGGDTGGHSGGVTFESLGASSTRVSIELGWEPEGVVEKVGAPAGRRSSGLPPTGEGMMGAWYLPTPYRLCACRWCPVICRTV